MPVDASGAPINVHTAAYNGHEELLEAYITQGGDIEASAFFLLELLCDLMLRVVRAA